MIPRRSAKCLPLKNWSDASARHQIINQVIFEEYILTCQQKRTGWANKARQRLLFYGIDIKCGTLYNYRQQLKSGIRSALTSSSFGGKLYEELGSRTGKEGMYKQIDLLVHLFIDNPEYIGLPANQLLYVIRKYNGNVVACEWDKKMFEFMRNLKARFAPGSAASIHYGDILSYLEDTDEKFSLYDFDLMQHLYNDDLDRIASAIARTSRPISIVNIASCIGRSRTEGEYKEIMPSYIIRELSNCGCEIIKHYSDGYSDRVTPMRYELLVVKCLNKRIWSLPKDFLV